MKLESKLVPNTQPHGQSVRILTLFGKITLADGVSQLRSAIVHSLEAHERHIVLNFGQVSTMDTAAVGELFRANTSISNIDGRISLCGLSPKMHQIFKITQILDLFDLYDNEEEAIASYQPGPG
ncbi:MAG: anti-sigma B factor antagonist [Phenylobacterium sp.]|jgi:anti-sigma B factor antagonist